MKRKSDDKVVPIKPAAPTTSQAAPASEANPEPEPEPDALPAILPAPAAQEPEVLPPDDMPLVPGGGYYLPPAPPIDEEIWTYVEIARYLRISVHQAQRIAATEGFPPAFKLPNGRGGSVGVSYWRAQRVIDWVLSYEAPRPRGPGGRRTKPI